MRSFGERDPAVIPKEARGGRIGINRGREEKRGITRPTASEVGRHSSD